MFMNNLIPQVNSKDHPVSMNLSLFGCCSCSMLHTSVTGIIVVVWPCRGSRPMIRDEDHQCGKQLSRLPKIPLGYPMIQWATFRARGTNRETKKKMLAGHITNNIYT